MGKISIVGLTLATSELATTDLPERSHQPGPDFIFPKRSFGKKSVTPGSYQHSWFSKWPFLHYNEAEDTGRYLSIKSFARPKNFYPSLICFNLSVFVSRPSLLPKLLRSSLLVLFVSLFSCLRQCIAKSFTQKSYL